MILMNDLELRKDSVVLTSCRVKEEGTLLTFVG